MLRSLPLGGGAVGSKELAGSLMAKHDSPSPQRGRESKEERARRIVAKTLGDDKFMASVREGLEAERRGEGVSFKDLKRKHGRR